MTHDNIPKAMRPDLHYTDDEFIVKFQRVLKLREVYDLTLKNACIRVGLTSDACYWKKKFNLIMKRRNQ